MATPGPGDVLTTERPEGARGRPVGRPSTAPPSPSGWGRRSGWDLGRRPASPSAAPALTAVALTMVDLSAAVGLGRVFAGRAWVGPALGTVAAVHLVAWLTRRLRLAGPQAAVAGAAATFLMVSWTVFGRTTFYGLPLGRTFSHLAAAWRALGDQFSSSVAPVTPDPSFMLLAAAGGGLVALLSDGVAFRLGRPLAALLPGLGVFIACCSGGQGGGRWILAPLLATTATTFLLTDRLVAARRQVWFGGAAPGQPWRSGAAMVALAAAAAVVTAPLTHAPDGTGALGWKAAAGPGGGGERIVPNPLVTLQKRLLQESNTPVFVVTSPVPSYWRLTSLANFTGDTWTSSGSYRGFGSKLPGAAPAGPGVRTVRATFRIQQLESVWLPDQFNPVAVSGARHVSYDPQSESLLAATATSDGQVYTVTSYQVLDTLDAAALEKVPFPSGAVTSSNTELPASVNGPIAVLAAEITRGHRSEYGKALAIQTYLRSAPFRYTLDAPADTSTSALDDFLFSTHAGYCQQFAGAYAVLARAAGIPTRLAVGFATGQSVSGSYQVYDRDAHTWPEVYFGPGIGWVPFEPTPGFAVPGAAAYAGTSGSPSGPPTAAPGPTTTVPAAKASDAPTTIPKNNRPVSPTTAAPPAVATKPGGSLWWLWPLGVAAGVGLWLAVARGSATLLRRRRRRAAERAGPGAVVAVAWSEVLGALALHGVVAARSETDDEFGRRAEAMLGTVIGRGELTAMAATVRQAVFSSDPEREGAGDALARAGRIEHALVAALDRGQRVRRAFLPAPGSVRQLISRCRRRGDAASGGRNPRRWSSARAR